MRRTLSVAALALLALAACSDDDPIAPTDPGRTVFGLDTQNRLVRFQSTTPGTIDRSVAVTGLAAGEALLGIDFRTATAGGGLYAVSSASRLYVIDTVSGAATAVSSTPFSPAVETGPIGWDFNPVPDRIRLHNATRQNLRLNQLTGTVAGVDGVLTYADGDVNAGRTPRLVGTAYTNAITTAAPTSTVLFAIDAQSDVLVRLANPNDGLLSTVGALGVDATDNVGFDIAGDTGESLAAIQAQGAPASALYRVNISGGVTRVGDIGGSAPLVGIAIRP